MNTDGIPLADGAKLETEVALESRGTAERNLCALIDTMSVGIVFADERGAITDLNAATLRMFGYTRSYRLRHCETTGGYIWVYSELGQGTAFKIYLPRVDQPHQSLEEIKIEPPVIKGTETILFAEDSESLREMATEYLQSVGYVVLCAASGREALQRAQDFQGAIHLLLTDVVMPDLNGPELAAQIVSSRPGIKLIFTSGYASEILAQRGTLNPAVAFIQKPYRPKALARKIREVLDAPSGPAKT
jgi:CheY-like chemotaxis protein